MGVLLAEFDARVQEIELYYSFLRALLADKADRLTGGSRRVYKISDDLAKILKANAYLLLYNLVESSVRDGLTRIYESVHLEGISYDKLCGELRHIWIEDRFRPDAARQAENTAARVIEVIEKVIAAEIVTFDPKRLPISGNIDAAKMRELAKRYGFSCKTTKRTRGGRALLDVKSERNSLAHGAKSFSECGRDATLNSLGSTKAQVILYLRQILRNIESYIAKKQFSTP
ncbi:MAG TPA: MAE_28990/MAE_18760 family HEPN-like nuclease [Acidobacteriaceae bacterium]|nr:MAE_28990/MAE_18760 family HEPN-like nuclease [Acidobacteriaceae bacterium]